MAGQFLFLRRSLALTDLAQLPTGLPWLLAQADQAAGNAAAPNPAPGGAGGAGSGGLFGDPTLLIMMVATFVLMYFLLMRPEQRKRKEQEQLLANLKDNDHVVTIGGICGVVVSTAKSSITIRVDDKTGTKLKVLRSAIARVGSPDDAAEEEAKGAK